MEGKKYILIFLLMGLPMLSASEPAYSERVYEAYVTGDHSRWKSVIDIMENASGLSPSQKLELLDYYYGYIGWALQRGAKREAGSMLDRADELLEVARRNELPPCMALSYEAAFAGLRIWHAPVRGLFTGRGALRAAGKAVAKDPDNPYARIALGQMKEHAPAFAGGCRTDAVRHYEKAVAIMERPEYEHARNWRYVDALSLLYRAYREQGRQKEAEAVRSRLRDIAPDLPL